MAEIKVLEQKSRASLDIRILVRDYLSRQHTVNLLRRQFERGFLPMETCISQSIPFRVRSRRNVSLPNAALSFLVGSLSKNTKAA